jgi:hypothetical protein
MYAACACSEATPRPKVSVVSTAWVAPGDPNAHTSRTPPHGSSPSVSCSGKIHRLPASRTASRTALPTAMWSAWFRDWPPQVSRKFPVTTISGRSRRTTSARGGAAARRTPGCRRAGQEGDLGDPHDPRRLHLLGLTHPAAFVRVRAADAGLAASHHAVGDVLALGGPRRQRRTPCRRGAPRCTGRGSSPRGAGSAVPCLQHVRKARR